MQKNKLRVGISVGDVNGVGVELIIKAFSDKEILDMVTPVIFGSNKLMSYQKNVFNQNNLNFQGIFNAKDAIAGKINVVNLWKDNVNIEYGKSTKESGQMAFSSLEAATKALKDGDIDVLVTAPINKDNIQSDKFQFPGHTEYLEDQLTGKSLMLLLNHDIRVALVTQHIPLSEVSKNISKDLIIQKAITLNNTLIQDFSIRKPKIAVLGLNPHAGDNGLLGKEENEIIMPAIKELNDKYQILAFGPFSADSFFQPKNLKNYDAVLAMYHDQGLIPFKTIAFEDGINFTAGLDKIRTSPDHGVAYDIAGQGIADVTSFREAIYHAVDIYKRRQENQALKQNALKSSSASVISGEDEDLPEY